MSDIQLTLISFAMGVLMGVSLYHFGYWHGEHYKVMQEIREVSCG